MVKYTAVTIAKFAQRRMRGRLENNELEMMRKETVVTYFDVFSMHFSGRTKEKIFIT